MKKVEIDNVNFGLRRETFSYEQRIRSLCARTESRFLYSIKKVEIDNVNFGLRRGMFNYERRIRSLCARTKNFRPTLIFHVGPGNSYAAVNG